MTTVAVPVTPVGPVAAATLVFRENGLVRVAAIVKATFAFGHHEPMRIAQPEAIFVKEVHRMNNPTRSIVATSDLVPRLPGADVILLGQAHATTGSTTHMTVRLAIGRGEETLLDKRATIVGDRKGAETKPFRAIPLVYEKTWGGPGFRDNPLGTGVLTGDAPPNIVDPHAPDRAIGFAPIARTWPSRTALAAADVRAALDKPFPEIPAGFDWRYFHAAPADQRLEQLVGDEWIVLEGVHPDHPRLQLQLPGAMALVRVVGTEADGRVFSLRGDTLRIDTDAERCTIVWRNSFPVREADLPVVQLLAGVALPDVPIAWPLQVEARAVEGGKRASRAPMHAAALSGGGTVVIEDAPELAATFSGTMEVADDDMEIVEDEEPDFSKTAVLAATLPPVTMPLPAAHAAVPLAPPSAHSGAPSHVHSAAPSHAHSGASSPAPAAVRQDPSPPAAPVRARPARDMKEATLDFSDNLAVLGRDVMPFHGNAAPPRAPEARGSSPIPGAPWDPSRPASAPLDDEDSTLDVGDDRFTGTLASRRQTVELPAPALAPPVQTVAARPASVPPPASVQPPARVEVQVKPGPPALFASASPDSAPTRLRELAPIASPAPVANPAQGASPAPVASPAQAASPAPVANPAQGASSAPVASPSQPASPAPAPSPVQREPAADPWGQSLREAPAPAAPRVEAPRTAPPAPGLQGSLYKRFKK